MAGVGGGGVANRPNAACDPRSPPIQAWLMYQFRFLFAAEECKTFEAFGGLRGQFNLLSVVLNLTVTEVVGMGLAYFRIIIIRLEEMARRRAIAVDEFPRLLPFAQLGVKEQTRRERALPLRSDPPKG